MHSAAPLVIACLKKVSGFFRVLRRNVAYIARVEGEDVVIEI